MFAMQSSPRTHALTTCLIILLGLMSGCNGHSETADGVLAEQIRHLDALVAALDAGDEKKADEATLKVGECQDRFGRFPFEEQQRAFANAGEKYHIALARVGATKIGMRGEARDAYAKDFGARESRRYQTFLAPRPREDTRDATVTLDASDLGQVGLDLLERLVGLPQRQGNPAAQIGGQLDSAGQQGAYSSPARSFTSMANSTRSSIHLPSHQRASSAPAQMPICTA
jgi:hypothetical protein